MRTFGLILVSVFMLFIGCSKNSSEKEKHFDFKDVEIVKANDLIEDIKVDFLFRFGSFLLTDDYLVFNDFTPTNPKGIHLFNRETFEYITSTGLLGRGPGEIVRLGKSVLSPCANFLWVDDNGLEVRWKFPIDSIISNKDFLPSESTKMDSEFFLVDYAFINDSVILGMAAIPLSASSMEMAMAKTNLNTNKTEKFGYEYPSNKDRYQTYSYFKLDRKSNRYIRCYENKDLMSICDLEGNLLFNVCGPLIDANSKEHKLYNYFKGSDVFKSYVLASYLGETYVSLKENEQPQIKYPSKLTVFDEDGNLVKIIEVGDSFSSFCIDEKYNRIILYFEGRENPLGYISLEGLIS